MSSINTNITLGFNFSDKKVLDLCADFLEKHNCYYHSVSAGNDDADELCQAFQFCSNLQEVNFPRDIQLIEKWAFYMCKNLKKVTVPKSCKIDGEAFSAGCKIVRV